MLANKELEVLSITDELTGISNRRDFVKHLESEWRRCFREEMSMSIIMIDIDYFKNYNDTYGHQMGDECLITIAQLINITEIVNRPGDMLARYGGEEFIVLLVDATAGYTEAIAKSIHNKVNELRILHTATGESNHGYVSISVGYARAENVRDTSYKEIIKKADGALYKAKDAGRNQVCRCD